jgi:carboxymethylenebutenolidase
VTPRPADGPWPRVVLLHEAPGLNDDIREHAVRFAARGRSHSPRTSTATAARRCLVATFRVLIAGKGKALKDIEGACRWLVERPDCAGHVGVIGFCLGGGYVLPTSPRGLAAATVN